MKTPCIFCDVIAGRRSGTPVYENASVIIIRDAHPQAPVHLLVIPKIHVTDITDAPAGMVTEVFQAARNIVRSLGISRFHIIHNGGGAQEIDHLHVHVMGRIRTSPDAAKS